MSKKLNIKTAGILAGGFILWFGISLITGTLCWFQATIGVPCPGCGSTRAAMELFRGNFAQAFFWHPLIIISLIILPYFFIRKLFFGHKPTKPIESKIIIAIAALYFVVFVVRMILMFPHTPPMVIHEDILIRQFIRGISGNGY